jgi:RNA polymerase sigma factor (sigma-70 family)
MTAPTRPPTIGAADPLDAFALYAAVFAFASNALTRMGCPEADRDDLAQRVVVKAYRQRHQHDPAQGTPGQWLWGIARNELRDERRRGRRELLIDAPSPASGAGGDTPTVEDLVLVKDLADFVWKSVPEAEQRVVWDRVIGRASFDEIAELQGISKSRAQRLYTRGMNRLRAALAREGERKRVGVAVPFGIDDLFDMRLGPPVSPEALARGFQALLVEMGRGDGGADRCCPPAEAADAAPPSSPHDVRPAVLRRALGPIVGVVVGVLVAAPMLPRCRRDREREEPPITAVVAELAAPARGAIAGCSDPGPAASPTQVANNAGPSLAPSRDGAGGVTKSADHAPALGSNAGVPDGRLALRGEGLWARACTRLRAAAPGEASLSDARCAGKAGAP